MSGNPGRLGRNQSASGRAEALFEHHRQEIFRSTDRLFARLMLVQWLGAILVACLVSPLSWAGLESHVHVHVWLAVFLGGAITLFPVWATREWPGSAFTRYSVATGQVLMSTLLIHLTGGRLETHFHIFGSLVILSFYRDWRVLIPATLLIAVDHFVRGIYWPFSAFGVLTASPWRSVEHTGWVVFEDVFLVISCLRSVREMQAIARRTAELEASEQRFRQFAEHIQEVFWMYEPRQQAMVYVSPAYEEVWGRPCEELYTEADAWLHGVHEEDRERVRQATLKFVTGEFHEEYRVVRPDGTVRWVRDRAFPITDESGEVYRIAGIAEDITQAREVQESLRLKSTLLQAQSEATVEGILVVSGEGRMISHNRRFAEMWDIPAEVIASGDDESARREVAGKVSDPAQFAARIEQLYASSDLEARDEVTLKDGRVLDRYTRPIKAPDGCNYGRIWFFRDVTEHQRAAEALRQAKEESERANLAKSEFLSRMSHELRTPLNAILGFGQILEMDALSPGQAQSIHHILKGGRHLLSLINEVLDIARIEAGRFEFSPEPIHLHSMVRETAALIEPLAQQRGIRLRVKEGGERNLYVHADMQRTKQVLLNLLSNAIKYNCEGGEVEVSCIRISPGEGEPGHVQVAIRDTGAGLTEEQLARLFTPFERLGAECTEVEGCGIGLALSKRLVEAMGGSIGVQSVPKAGSTFSFRLPATSAPESHLAAPPTGSQEQGAGAARPTHTILQIEDNVANMQVIECMLARRSDLRLLTAMQGQLGIEFAREHRPELILLDLHLPDLPGAEVLSRLRADPCTQNIPVVVISADATQNQIQRLLAKGALAYLTKPLDLAKLMETIDAALAGRLQPMGPA